MSPCYSANRRWNQDWNSGQSLNSVLSLGSLHGFLSQRRSLSVPGQWCTYIFIYICVYMNIYIFMSIFLGHASQEIADCPFPWCFQNPFPCKWWSGNGTSVQEWMDGWGAPDGGGKRWNDGPWPQISRWALALGDRHPFAPQPNCLLWLLLAAVEAKLSTTQSVTQ